MMNLKSTVISVSVIFRNVYHGIRFNFDWLTLPLNKRRFRVQTLSVYIFFHEPDETFQSVLCPSFLSYSSVAAVCVFRTA